MHTTEAYSLNHELLLRHRQEMANDLGSLALSTVSVGIIDAPRPVVQEQAPIAPTPEASAEFVTDLELCELRNKTMARAAFNSIKLNQAAYGLAA